MDKNDKAFISMVLIAILEACAILKDMDGALFGVVIAALAGLGGYELGKRTSSEHEEA